jgi:hypothetical protein
MLLPTQDSEDTTITELADRVQAIEASIQEGVDALGASYEARNGALQRTRQFKAQDLVYVDRQYPKKFEIAGIDTKFYFPYRPELYVVLEKRSAQMYRLRVAHAADAKHEDVHVQRMKPFVSRADALQFADFAVAQPD